MSDHLEVIAGLVMELRRGVIVLGVLSQMEEPAYGYALMQRLEERGLPVDAGTLYPLLRRLEKQKLLRSDWETSGPKPRKYYVLSETGRAVYHQLSEEWSHLAETMEQLLHEKEQKSDDHD